MGTNIRVKLSEKSAEYLSKERRLELQHFCMQYGEWKKELDKCQ